MSMDLYVCVSTDVSVFGSIDLRVFGTVNPHDLCLRVYLRICMSACLAGICVSPIAFTYLNW